jgi:L,D-transpeptidase catalytic domain
MEVGVYKVNDVNRESSPDGRFVLPRIQWNRLKSATVPRCKLCDRMRHTMTRFTEPMHNLMVLRSARLALASLAVLVLVGDHAHSAGGRSERSVESINSRAAGEPILAIISLRSQRITIYDAKGWTVRAPVSSGQKGRETPAGIFSVSSRRTRTTTLTSMTMPGCPICSASLGRGSRSMAAPCPGIRRPMAACGCRSTSQRVCLI